MRGAAVVEEYHRRPGRQLGRYGPVQIIVEDAASFMPAIHEGRFRMARVASLKAERLRLHRLLLEGAGTTEEEDRRRPGDRNHVRLMAEDANLSSLPAIRAQYERTNRTLERILRGRYESTMPLPNDVHWTPEESLMGLLDDSSEDRSDVSSAPVALDAVREYPSRFLDRYVQSQETHGEYGFVPAADVSRRDCFGIFSWCRRFETPHRIKSKMEWMKDDQKGEKLCPICLECSKDLIQFPHARAPGGDVSDHRMCRECFARNGDNVCPMCRGEKKRKVALLNLHMLFWWHG